MDVGVQVKIETGGMDAIASAMQQAASANPSGPVRDMYTQWGRRIEAFNRRRFELYSRGGGDWAPLALSTIRSRGGKPSKGLSRFGGGGDRANTGGLGRGARSSLARDTGRGRIVAFPGGYTKVSPLVPAGRTVAILRNTGILMNALTIGQPGNTFTMIPSGVVYGIDGPARHPVVARFLASVGQAASRPARAGSVRDRVERASKRGSGTSGAVSIADIAAYHHNGGQHLPRRRVVAEPDQNTMDGMAGDAIRAIQRVVSSVPSGTAR